MLCVYPADCTDISSNGIGTLMPSLVSSHAIGDLIQPMIREIHLFDTYVAGTTHLEDQSVLERILVGDELVLQREDNPFDKKAILVLNAQKQKLGYPASAVPSLLRPALIYNNSFECSGNA